MLNTQDNRTSHSLRAWYFVGLTFLLSAIPYYFIIESGTTESDWIMLLMWIPALAAIILRLVYREGFFSGVSWNPFRHTRWLLIAAFLPFFIEIATLLLSIGLEAAILKPDFISLEKGMVSIRGTALIFGASAQPWYQFIGNYLLSYLIGTFFYSLVFALGEEFGWRAYLQKKWLHRHELSTFIIIGLIWGYWHLPGILLGHNYPDYPLLGGLVLMPVVTILFSICFGLSLKLTNVIWVPVVFHGAINISADISNVALIEDSIQNPVVDCIWTSLWFLATIFLWRWYQKTQVKNISSSHHNDQVPDPQPAQ